jgi:hypothetical protein
VRAFTQPIRDLLRAPSLRMRLLMTFFLDEGTYRFCDDAVDVTDGTNLWIGASALGSTVEMKSGRDLAAEPITLVLDGNHMTQAGITDPARVLRDIMGYLYTQNRTDIAWGLSYPDSAAIQLTVPTAAMKINTARLIDEKLGWDRPNQQVVSKLEITLDSLAMRYTRSSFRTRSHADQQDIDPTDMFFSFTADAINTEKTLYWGKGGPGTPVGSSTGGSGGSPAPVTGGGGGGSNPGLGGYVNMQ